MQEVLDGAAGATTDPRSPSATDQIGAHTATCAGCREEWADLQRIQSALGSMPSLAAPDRIWQAVAQRIDRDEAPRPAPAAWERWFHDVLLPVWPVLAGAAAIWFVGIGVRPVSTPDSQQIAPIVVPVVSGVSEGATHETAPGAKLARTASEDAPALAGRGGPGGITTSAGRNPVRAAAQVALASLSKVAARTAGQAISARAGGNEWDYVEGEFAAYTRRLLARGSH